MKVIDLLNKIANNEEVPKKIFYKGNVYYQVGDVCFNNLCYENCEIDTDEWKFLCAIENLNDEVEIIEEKEQKEIPRIEEKKIPEKLETLNTNYHTKEVYYENYSKEEIALDIETLQIWINKLIDYLKSKGDK